MARAALRVALLGMLLASFAFARTGPFCQPGSLTLCEPGPFTPLGIPGEFFDGVGSPAEAFVVGADTVPLGICGAAPVRFYCRRGARAHTYFRTTWESCPPLGRVKLKGHILPGCVELVGTLRWRDPSSGRRRVLKVRGERAP